MGVASFVTRDGGAVYEWLNDTIRVRLGGVDTDGLYTLTEDRMKPSFSLGMHVHKSHAETFHILEGEVEFQLDGRIVVAAAGTSVHVPANVPHAARVANGLPAHMLMLYAPAGFEDFLARMKDLTPGNFADRAFMKAFNEGFDLVELD